MNVQLAPASTSATRQLVADVAPAAALWRGLVEQIPAVTYIADFDAAATLRYVSPQIEQLLGRPPADFLADLGLWYACVHPDDLERVRAEELRTFTAQLSFDCEFRMRHADGHEVVVWERDAIIRDQHGVPTHTQGVVIDVTALRTMRDALHCERANAARYLEVAGTAIVVLDREGRVQSMNRAAYELTGRPEGSMRGKELLGAVFTGVELRESRARFATAMRSGELPATTERSLHRPDGTVREVVWAHRVLREEDGGIIGMVSSGTDLTQQRADAAEIAHLANHDPVTDLPNRQLFATHLDLAYARARRAGRAIAVLYLDLDDFKLINDSLGHKSGDLLLVKVARRLRARMRAGDVIARHGGDEFLVLLGDLDPATAADGAQRAARSLLDGLAIPFVVAGTEVHLTASAGISLLPADALDAESLLRHADAAMHQAKGDGHDRVRVYVPDHREPLQRLSLISRLRHAIDEEELVVHWQPIAVPATGELRALEALVRWQDPERGLVMPDLFVPFAEEAGIIDRLGDLVLDLVGRQRVRWREQYGFEPIVHVNVSPRELRTPGFAARVAVRLAEHALDPATVVLELTESAAMQDPGRTVPLLHELAQTGIRLAIDDFGAGHSSLGRLIGLPVDVLKIDRSFLARSPADPAAAAVLSAVMSLAAALDMQAVAEGVETEEQRRQLVALGCPLAQGYLLGRPGPAEAMLPHLQRAAL